MAPRRTAQAAIIGVLEHCGPLDDDQLGAALGVSRQSARSAALRMLGAGLVARARQAGGKWVTSLVPGGRAEASDADPPHGTEHAALDESAAVTALSAIYAFTGGKPPRARIATLEQGLAGAGLDQVTGLLRREMVSDSTFARACWSNHWPERSTS